MATVRVTVPFAQIPEWVLDHTQGGFSPQAVRLYGILQRYGNSPGHEAVPGRTVLAERIGCSVSTVKRARQELIDGGALIVLERPGKTNVYILETGAQPTRVIGEPGVMGDPGGGPSVNPDREQSTESVEAKASTRTRDPIWDTLEHIFGAAPAGKAAS